MEADEHPVQIVITQDAKGYYKVAIMSPTKTLETANFASLDDALDFTRIYANHLNPAP